MTLNKSQIARLDFIDRQIRKGGYPNAQTIAKQYEVNPKTIQRDIDFLRDQKGAPIEYDRIRHGYYYTDLSYQLTPIEISESDLFAICIADVALKQYENTDIYPRLKAIFEKIADQLSDRISIDCLLPADSISVMYEPARRVNPKIWQTVAKSLRNELSLKFMYQSPVDKKPSQRIIDPYHLSYYRGDWYVIGRKHDTGKENTYAVSRMQSAEMLNTRYEIPVDFNYADRLKSQFGIIGGNKKHKVVISFSAKQAPYVIERDWHPSQKIKMEKDGGLVLTLETTDLFEIRHWILSWGAEAKVLAPKELVDEVKKELERAKKLYSK